MKTLHAILIVSAALGGCSGGSSPQDSLTDPLPITSNNAVPAVKASWEAANSSADLSALIGMSGFVTATPSGQAKPGITIPGNASIASMMQNVSVGPITIPCAVSGSTTTSGDLANPEKLTQGDTMTVDADNCDDGFGEVIDGQLALAVSNFFGDIFTGAYDVGMSINLIDFQITTADDVIVKNGDVNVSLNATQINDSTLPIVYLSVAGWRLTTDTNAASVILADYLNSQDIILDGGLEPASYGFSVSGTVDSIDLAGSVRYRTPASFQGLEGRFPHAGELLVIGASSSARLIAVDDINIQIEIDSNDDGSVDETIITTWVEFEG